MRKRIGSTHIVTTVLTNFPNDDERRERSHETFTASNSGDIPHTSHYSTKPVPSGLYHPDSPNHHTQKAVPKQQKPPPPHRRQSKKRAAGNIWSKVLSISDLGFQSASIDKRVSHGLNRGETTYTEEGAV